MKAIEDGDIEADILGDLRTDNNKLSIFLVENEDAAQRVTVAVSMNFNSIKFQEIGYVMIDEDIFRQLQITPQPDESDGKTKDKEVNSWHVNLIDLTGRKLVELARTLLEQCELKAFIEDDFYDNLVNCILRENLRLEDINDKAIRQKAKDRLIP